jgi:hypothetical protein
MGTSLFLSAGCRVLRLGDAEAAIQFYKEDIMAKQIENVLNEEFDFMLQQGWITEDGSVTKAGVQTIFGGQLPADGVEYRRADAEGAVPKGSVP